MDCDQELLMDVDCNLERPEGEVVALFRFYQLTLLNRPGNFSVFDPALALALCEVPCFDETLKRFF